MRSKLKLVFFSGGQNIENKALHQSVVGLARGRRRKRLTYFPFCADGSGVFYSRIIRRYKPYGVQEFKQLMSDQPLSKSQIRNGFETDIIYLAGGNTFYFLKHLREQGLLPLLREFAQSGGVLAGLSAGAILMTPSIRLASIPSHEADENEVGLEDLRALNLVDFEFSPHYSLRSLKSTRELLAYSKRSPHPIYACPDGAGIVVDRGKFCVFGRSFVFLSGRRAPLGA